MSFKSPPLARRAIDGATTSPRAENNIKALWQTGGEALLRLNTCLALIGYAQEKGLQTGIATNGLLLARHARTLKQAGLDQTRVSLDSLNAATFDSLRGTKGALPTVLRGIETAAAEGIQTSLRLTLTTANKDQIEPIVRYARNHGVHAVEVKAVLPIGRGSVRAMLPAPELSRLMAQAVSLSTKQTSVSVLCSYLSPCSGLAQTQKNHVPCVCGTEAMYVGVSGSILPCSYFPDLKTHHVTTHAVQDLWQGAAFAQVREPQAKECQRCDTWTFCRNGCPALLAHHNANTQRCHEVVAGLT